MKWNKCLAVGLLAVFFANLVWYAPVHASANLIKGGSFELLELQNSSSVWLTAAATFIPSTVKKFGHYGMRVMDRTENWSSMQQWVSLKEGGTYTGSVWVRLHEGEDTMQMVLDVYAQGIKHQPVIAEAKVGTEWVNISGSIKLSIGAPIERAKVYVRTTTSLADVYMDNFELWDGAKPQGTDGKAGQAKAPLKPSVKRTNPEDKNLSFPDLYKISVIENGNFEYGLTGWHGANADVALAGEAVSGNASAKVSALSANGGIRRWTDIDTNKSCIVSAWVKPEKNTTIAAQIELNTSSPQTITATSVEAAAGEWTHLYEVVTFDRTGTADGGYLTFTSTTGDFLIDAVELYEVAGKTAAAAKDPAGFIKTIQLSDKQNLVINGGFEADTSNWVTSEGKISVSTVDKYSGNASCLVTGRTATWGSAQQFVPIEPKKSYVASAWVRLVGASDTVRLYLDYWEGETKKGIAIDAKTSSDNWVHLQGVVKLENVTSAKIYVMTASSRNDYFIDDVSIFETEAGSSVLPSYLVTGKEKNSLMYAPWNNLYEWDFSTLAHSAYSLAGWRVENHSVKVSDMDGKTGMVYLNKEPYIVTPRDNRLSVSAADTRYVRIKMKNNSNAERAELYWSTQEAAGFSPERRANFPIEKTSAGFVEYILDMSRAPQWQGTVTALKFVPATEVFSEDDAPVGSVILDFISISNTDGDAAFTDTAQHWAAGEIQALLEKNAIGRATDRFLPDHAITRAEFTDILIRALNMVPSKTRRSSLSDAPENADWYQSLVAAEDAGVITGQNGLFLPQSTITREEVAAIVIRACEYFERRGEWAFTAAAYGDDAQISGWARQYVYIATSLGLMQGDSGNFAPQNTITKAESAALIYRLANWINGDAQNDVFLSGQNAFVYDIVRMTLPDSNGGVYQNPFDGDEVSVEALFTAPSGEQLRIPAYFDLYDDFSFDPRRSIRGMTPKAYWKVRFTPVEAGDWHYTVEMKHKGNMSVLTSGSIRAEDAARDGFVRVDPDHPRFVLESGKPFFGIGTNLCWPDGSNHFNTGAGLTSYEEYYQTFVDENGGNFVRIWLEDSSNGVETRYTGPGIFDNKHASRLDYIMLLSRQKGVKIIPAIRTFHFLETTRWWLNGSHTDLNGGYLALPREIFTNGQAIKAYKDMLRYLVARYSAYDNLVAWEFWNEENGITAYQYVKEDALRWYDTMQQYVSEIDPYKHMTGTSFGNVPGEHGMFSKETVHWTSAHVYGVAFWPEVIRGNSVTKQVLYPGVPQFFEEQGLKQQDNVLDPAGVSLHNSLWASLVTGDTATAMPWWWDTYLKNNQLFQLYNPIRNMVADLVWPDTNSRMINLKTESGLKGDYLVPAGYDINNGTNLDPYTSFTLDFETESLLEIGEYIHRVHMEKGRTYTFHVNLPHESAVIVTFMGASFMNVNGGTIGVQIDDGEMITALANPENKPANTFRVPVLAGRHKIVVTNPGNEKWALAGVSFENTVPLVEAVGAMGDNNGIFWLRDRHHSWTKVHDGYAAPRITDARVDLEGIAAGTYELIWLDTVSGAELGRQEVSVTHESAPVIDVPAFEKDIAFKLVSR